MEEMATWDMIFNKTNYGKTGNECPSKDDGKIHTISNDIEQIRIKFRGASIEEGYNNKTLTITQVDSSDLGNILTDMRYNYGNSTTRANHMTLNCSVQSDFSNSYNFAFNITGNKI